MAFHTVSTDNHNTCENLSSESWRYLKDKNHELILNTIPLQLYNLLLMVIGIIGNLLVIYIYGKKMLKVRVFVASLVITSMCTCHSRSKRELFAAMASACMWNTRGCLKNEDTSELLSRSECNDEMDREKAQIGSAQSAIVNFSSSAQDLAKHAAVIISVMF